MPAVACVYKIICVPTGRCYVGSTVHRDRRWRFHRWQLNKGTHHSFRLQRAWSKHGAEAFAFKVIETVIVTGDTRAVLQSREQHWMDCLHPELNRSASVNRHSLGVKLGPPSEETREKIRKAVTGKRHSPETRARLSVLFRGRKLNLTEDQRKRRAASGRKRAGWKMSEESRRKVAEAQTGRVRSAETRTKHSLKLKGKPWSESRWAAELCKRPRPGLVWERASGCWRVRLTIDGRRVNLGAFPNLVDAEAAYDAAKIGIPVEVCTHKRPDFTGRTCCNCGRPIRHARKGRCQTCRTWQRKHGSDRPVPTPTDDAAAGETGFEQTLKSL